MTSPMPSSSSSSAQPGRLIGEYGGSNYLILLVVIGVVCLLFGIFGLFGGEGFDTPSRLFVDGLGIICFVVAFLSRGAHAELYEGRFTISRGGKTVSGRWEDVANVAHQMTRRYLYGIIPLPGISHTYTVTMRNGERMKIDSSFKNAREAGETMERMWRQAVAAAKSSGPTS